MSRGWPVGEAVAGVLGREAEGDRLLVGVGAGEGLGVCRLRRWPGRGSRPKKPKGTGSPCTALGARRSLRARAAARDGGFAGRVCLGAASGTAMPALTRIR